MMMMMLTRMIVRGDEQGDEWGRLDPWEAPSANARTRCLEVCHDPPEVCRGTSLEDIMQRARMTTMNYHPLGAWLATIYQGSKLMRFFRTTNDVNQFDRAAAIHGSAWQSTSHHMLGLDFMTKDDVTRLAPDIIAKAMATCNSTGTQFAMAWACAHGIGHATVLAATMVVSDGGRRRPPTDHHISCTGPPTVTHSGEALQIAESICAAMPSRDLGYACADGLYMSWAGTECPPGSADVPLNTMPTTRDGHVRLISDVFTQDPMFLACANATYVSACIFGAVVGLIEDFYMPRSFHGFESDRNGRGTICSEPFPVDGIVNLLCQAPVWSTSETLLRSCLYGAAWAISDPHWCFSGGRQMFNIRHFHRISGITVPAWCANITTSPTTISSNENIHDDNYAFRVAACALAPLYHITAKAFEIETAATPKLNRSDLVTTCQTFCADLGASDDPAIRAVAPICATNLAICASLDGAPLPNVSFVPTNLFEHVYADDVLPPSFPLFVGYPRRACGRNLKLYTGDIRSNYSHHDAPP